MDISVFVERELKRVIDNTLASPHREKYLLMTDSEKEELHEKQRENSREWIGKIVDRIESGSPDDLRNKFHLGNPTSRELFTVLTGVKLPNTESGTREAIRKWYGAERWDAFWEKKWIEEEEQQALRKEQKKQRELKDKLSERVRYPRPGGGVSINGTFEEYLRLKLSEGFRPEDRKRGFSTGWVLKLNGMETPQFRGKIVREWIDSVIPEYEATQNA